MLLFHGTSLKRFKQAIKDGFLGTESTLWSASEGETTYFYNEKFIKEEYDLTEKEEIKEMGVRFALESSVFALAEDKQYLRRVVLVFDSRKLNKIGKVEKDDSCGDNMNHCSKFVGKIPLNLIEKIFIDSQNMDLFALYFIGSAYAAQVRAQEARQGPAYYINQDFTGLDTPMLEAAQEVYEKLNMYFLENFDTIEATEETTIEKINALESC
jgi:hypothetical protein